MKRHLIVLPIALLAMLPSCATYESRPPEALVQEFRGEAKAVARSNAQLIADYAAALDSLMPGLSAEKEPDRQPAEQALEDMCVRSARPGAERDRRALCEAMAARIGSESARSARMWMLRQLARIGRGECVDALAQILAEDDPMVRDAARRALQNDPDVAAHVALHHELAVALNSTGRHPDEGGIATRKPHADDPAWAAALVNALAAHAMHEDETAYSLAALVAMSDDQPILAEAAINALGKIGEVSFLDYLHDNADMRAKLAAHNLTGRWAEAELRTAEGLLARRKTDAAVAVYRKLLDVGGEPQYAVAALSGLARAQGDKALPLLMEQMTRETSDKQSRDRQGAGIGQKREENPLPYGRGSEMRGSERQGLSESSEDEAQVRLAAAALACDLPGGEKVTKQLADHLTSLPADVQVRLIDGLATRGGKTARVAVLGCLDYPNRDVRAAAVRALGQLGDASHIYVLARIAAERGADEQKAARESLAALRDPAFDQKAFFIVESAPAVIQAEILRALRARGSRIALAWSEFNLCQLEPVAQIAVLEYVGKLGSGPDLRYIPGVLPLLSKNAEVLTAAEDAVVSIILRDSQDTYRCGDALVGLEENEDTDKLPFIRILGRVGDVDGLEAIRKCATSSHPAVKDAAIRALCDWKDAAAMPDVQGLMKTSTDPAHRTLAFRAYVRLVKLPTKDRTPQATLAMVDEALALAKSADEKKLVFSGMSDLACVEAMDRLEAALPDAALQAEAAVAICGVAKAIGGQHADRARAAIERVRGYPVSDAVKTAADEALKHIDRYVGYVTTWKFCGPYSVTRKEAGDLFDLAIGPEPGADATLTPDMPRVDWRPLVVTDENEPWLFDLTKVTTDSNRVVYVRATVTCPAETAAKLEIGSDDNVKAWLNGQLVHANKAFRPLAVASDTVNVTLKPGANDLMLKVVQGSGGFGVCCGVKAPDGSNIAGLKIAAE